MSAESLQNLARPHYERLKENLRETVTDVLKRQRGQDVDILEVGPGPRSILVRSIEDPTLKPSSEYDLHGRRQVIHVLFVDRDNLPTIGGTRVEFSFDENGAGSVSIRNLMLEGRFVQQEFNQYLESSGGREQRAFDLIVMHGALHEMYIASTEEAADSYFTELFKRLHGLLKKEGLIFFGDPYYPPYYTSVEAHSVVDHLRTRTNHGNTPVSLMHPEYLLSLIVKPQESAFRLLRDEEIFYSLDGTDLGRKFYFVLLQKVG